MNPTEGRLSSDDRREQILAAATRVFGERGYAGGTTDAIAREAGISQAYVVRMFGSKESLFREVAVRATERLATAFRDTIEALGPESTVPERRMALATAYARLVSDRGVLQALLHLFSLGHDESFGPLGRACFLDIYRLVRDEAGFSADEATEFFAQGMLVTILTALRMPTEVSDPAAQELLGCAMGEQKLAILAGLEAGAVSPLAR